jgi:hypothetical protein
VVDEGLTIMCEFVVYRVCYKTIKFNTVFPLGSPIKYSGLYELRWQPKARANRSLVWAWEVVSDGGHDLRVVTGKCEYRSIYLAPRLTKGKREATKPWMLRWEARARQGQHGGDQPSPASCSFLFWCYWSLRRRQRRLRQFSRGRRGSPLAKEVCMIDGLF